MTLLQIDNAPDPYFLFCGFASLIVNPIYFCTCIDLLSFLDASVDSLRKGQCQRPALDFRVSCN